MSKHTPIPPDFDITKATREEVRKMRSSPAWNEFELNGSRTLIHVVT